MKVIVDLYSSKPNDIYNFLNKFYDNYSGKENELKWEKDFTNPIEIADIVGVFIDNNEVGKVIGERCFTSEIIDFIFNPMFVNYYESVKPKIEKIMGYTSRNQSNWSNDIFRMGWLVRNSLSHNKKISFSDSSSRDILWRGKVIQTSNHNEPIHQHLNFTDIFILMFDMDEELSKVFN